MERKIYLQFTKQYVLAALKKFEWPAGLQPNLQNMPIQATLKCGNLRPGESWLSRSEILQVRLRDLKMGTYYQARHQGGKINNDRDTG